MKITVFFVFVLMVCPVSAGAAVTEKDTYWDNGKIRSKQETSDTGDPVMTSYYRQDGTLEQTLKYDNDGNKIAEARYGNDGKLENGPEGWAAMRWKYIGGNMRGEAYYDESGQLTEYKKYNASGDLVSKKYVGDSEPDPSEEYQPGPTLAGEEESFYDSYGRPEGTTSVEYDDFPYPDWWYREGD